MVAAKKYFVRVGFRFGSFQIWVVFRFCDQFDQSLTVCVVLRCSSRLPWPGHVAGWDFRSRALFSLNSTVFWRIQNVSSDKVIARRSYFVPPQFSFKYGRCDNSHVVTDNSFVCFNQEKLEVSRIRRNWVSIILHELEIAVIFSFLCLLR
jgi:hypothetical protein